MKSGLRFINDRRERRILQNNCRSLQLCPHLCSVIISRSCEDQFGPLFGVLKVADNEFHELAKKKDNLAVPVNLFITRD